MAPATGHAAFGLGTFAVQVSALKGLHLDCGAAQEGPPMGLAPTLQLRCNGMIAQCHALSMPACFTMRGV